MRIKIYRFFDGRAREVANGRVDLSYPPKITECRAVVPNAAGVSDEVREHIELILKNDLIPGHLGLEGTLEHYKPPVREPFVRINGADFAWTIEETPFESAREEIEDSLEDKSDIEFGDRFQRGHYGRETLQGGFENGKDRPGSRGQHRPEMEFSPKGEAGEKRKKILIVEDNLDFSKALKIRLQDGGYDVVAAFDALQGISLVHKHKPDLIILDILMPAGWGFTVAQKLKHSGSAWLKSIPIIFITGSQDERHEKMAMRLGARYYFRKPISHEALLDAVKSILEGKP